MTARTPIPFQRIDFDKLKEVNNDLATERNTPKLQFPAQAPVEPRREGEGASVVKAVTPKELTTHVSVQLPIYLAKMLKARVATDGVTMRYFLTKLLKDNGFHVDEVDLIEDGRRVR
jgi:hypothetical protein